LTKASFKNDRNGIERTQTPVTQTGRKRSNTVIGHDGTVGMSNFEYSRRKFMERLKEWWQTHFRVFGTKKVPNGREIPQQA